MSLSPQKIATVRNQDAILIIYHNQYSEGAEKWERVIAEGDEAMKAQFDKFVLVNIHEATFGYYPYEWGYVMWLARKYAEALDYEVTNNILEELEKKREKQLASAVK